MRGVVTGIVPDGSYGQISAEDGQRYSYWTSEVRNGPIEVGQTVEFEMWEGQPIDIHGVPKVAPADARQRLTMLQQQLAEWTFDLAASLTAAAKSLPPRDYWITLFTSPSGRISRRQFWLHGVLPLAVADILFGWIPIIGRLLSLAVLWGSICIAFKRFHDLGYPGWYSLVYLAPIGAGVIFTLVGIFVGSYYGLLWLIAYVFFAMGTLIWLAQFALVYIRIGQNGANKYGPDPLEV